MFQVLLDNLDIEVEVKKSTYESAFFLKFTEAETELLKSQLSTVWLGLICEVETLWVSRVGLWVVYL
jgi:hypothetical protein